MATQDEHDDITLMTPTGESGRHAIPDKPHAFELFHVGPHMVYAHPELSSIRTMARISAKAVALNRLDGSYSPPNIWIRDLQPILRETNAPNVIIFPPDEDKSIFGGTLTAVGSTPVSMLHDTVLPVMQFLRGTETKRVAIVEVITNDHTIDPDKIVTDLKDKITEQFGDSRVGEMLDFPLILQFMASDSQGVTLPDHLQTIITWVSDGKRITYSDPMPPAELAEYIGGPWK